MKNTILKDRQLAVLERLIIVGLALVPLFFSFPYRVNIFLSWEGAYRLYSGQIPYKDFGLPMGFAFWVIPAVFFKIFGPYLISLVKAQVFVNIISGLAFLSILKSFSIDRPLRLICLLVFCISYSFFNFWPWYDQSVIVFEIIAISFVLKSIFSENSKYSTLYLALGSLFAFISIFTKQDGGGMAFMICFALITYNTIIERKIKPLLLFALFFFLVSCLVIIPFVPYNFTYWFNYGQSYQNSRLSVYDIISAFLAESQWIKFYLFIIVLMLIFEIRKSKKILKDKKFMLFIILTIGILGEASIYQVTSYTPPDNNIFFHSFAFAFIFGNLEFIKQINFRQIGLIIGSTFLVLLWWSGSYWKYIDRLARKFIPQFETTDSDKVSIHTYMDRASSSNLNADMNVWVYSDLKVFKDIYMPQSTVNGMTRLMKMPLIKNGGARLKVLNMTELTPLAYQIGYKLETGDDIPLWYHKGVGMFQKQVDSYCDKIKNHFYDLVLFENIPELNNFYPFEVDSALNKYYKKVDSFSGPRRAQVSEIEVFVKPDSSDSVRNYSHN